MFSSEGWVMMLMEKKEYDARVKHIWEKHVKTIMLDNGFDTLVDIFDQMYTPNSNSLNISYLMSIEKIKSKTKDVDETDIGNIIFGWMIIKNPEIMKILLEFSTSGKEYIHSYSNWIYEKMKIHYPNCVNF